MQLHRQMKPGGSEVTDGLKVHTHLGACDSEHIVYCLLQCSIEFTHKMQSGVLTGAL